MYTASQLLIRHYMITQCYLPPGRGDILPLPPPKMLSGATRRLFAYGPADATAIPNPIVSFKSSPVLPFWYQLTQVVLEKRPLNWCSSVEVIGHVSTECCCHILNVAEHASSWSYEQPHLYKSVETSTLTSISSSAFSRLFLSMWLRSVFFINSCNNIHNRDGSVAKWLACWTQAQKGPGSNRSRDAVG